MHFWNPLVRWFLTLFKNASTPRQMTDLTVLTLLFRRWGSGCVSVKRPSTITGTSSIASRTARTQGMPGDDHVVGGDQQQAGPVKFPEESGKRDNLLARIDPPVVGVRQQVRDPAKPNLGEEMHWTPATT